MNLQKSKLASVVNQSVFMCLLKAGVLFEVRLKTFSGSDEEAADG